MPLMSGLRGGCGAGLLCQNEYFSRNSVFGGELFVNRRPLGAIFGTESVDYAEKTKHCI